MKTKFKALLFVFAFASTHFSCHEPELLQSTKQPEVNKFEIIDFKGERVSIPADFPKELFDQTQAEFDLYYAAISAETSARTSVSVIGITYEELLPILLRHTARFPQINSEVGVDERDLERIFRDFPDIETLAEANEKRVTIFDYYQTLCKRDVVKEVIEFEKAKSERGRVLGDLPGSLTTPEKNHLLLNPGYAQRYVQAAENAIFFTQTMYGNQDQGNKANAFQHATWNALSIRFILKGTPASENQAIDFTQDGTSKHEQNNNGDQIQDKHAAMDLHNNMSAREWMKNETSWGFGPFRSIPSVEDIINTMSSRANSSAMHPMIDILNWHGGNNANTWNNLYNNLYSPHQHLVHINP